MAGREWELSSVNHCRQRNSHYQNSSQESLDGLHRYFSTAFSSPGCYLTYAAVHDAVKRATSRPLIAGATITPTFNMSGPLRTKQGCWTCRLRKKKCDEASPRCSTCESLSITCYGFGAKPGWMNDGDKARAVANDIKEIVKQTSRRRFISNPSKTPGTFITIAPKSSDLVADSSSDAGSSLQRADGVNAPSDHEPQQDGLGMHIRSSVSKPVQSLPGLQYLTSRRTPRLIGIKWLCPCRPSRRMSPSS